jgi:hypothetical protein
MPRKANTLSALKSEPGSFGSEKTIETRNVVVEVLYGGSQRLETEHLAGAR